MSAAVVAASVAAPATLSGTFFNWPSNKEAKNKKRGEESIERRRIKKEARSKKEAVFGASSHFHSPLFLFQVSNGSKNPES